MDSRNTLSRLLLFGFWGVFIASSAASQLLQQQPPNLWQQQQHQHRQLQQQQHHQQRQQQQQWRGVAEALYQNTYQTPRPNTYQTHTNQPVKTLTQSPDHLTATFERIGRLYQTVLYHRADVVIDLSAAHEECLAGREEVGYHSSKLWGILKRNDLSAGIPQPHDYNATLGDFRHGSDAHYLGRDNHNDVPRKTFGARLVASYREVNDLYRDYTEDCRLIDSLSPMDVVKRGSEVLFTFLAGTVFQFALARILEQTVASLRVEEPSSDFILPMLEGQSHELLYHGTKLTWTHFQTTLDHQVSRMTAVRNHNRAKLMQLESALSDLQRGQLSLGVVNRETLGKIYRKAQETARSTGTEVPFSSPSSILELPTTYSINSTQLTVHVLVPLVGEAFKLYKAAPVPIVLADQTQEPLLFLIDAEPNLIGVSDEGDSIIVPTAEELETCVKLGGDRICTAPVQSKLAYDCLPCLYFGNQECASRTCSVQQSHKPWIVRRAPEEQYAVTVMEYTDLKTHCYSTPAQSTASLTLSPGTSIVKVPPGCTATTKLFSIRAPYVMLSSPIVSTSISWDVRGGVFHNLTNEELLLNEEVLRLKAFHTRAAANEIKNPAPSFATLAAMTSAVAASAVVLTSALWFVCGVKPAGAWCSKPSDPFGFFVRNFGRRSGEDGVRLGNF